MQKLDYWISKDRTDWKKIEQMLQILNLLGPARSLIIAYIGRYVNITITLDDEDESLMDLFTFHYPLPEYNDLMNPKELSGD